MCAVQPTLSFGTIYKQADIFFLIRKSEKTKTSIFLKTKTGLEIRRVAFYLSTYNLL